MSTNNVFVGAFLVPESLERLQAVFMSSPLTINWDHVCVPLFFGPPAEAAHVGISPDTYVLEPRAFTQVTDPWSGQVELAAPIESTPLAIRALQWGAGSDFPLRLTFQRYAPGLSMANKFFISSISDVFAFHPEPYRVQERVLAVPEARSENPWFNQ